MHRDRPLSWWGSTNRRSARYHAAIRYSAGYREYHASATMPCHYNGDGVQPHSYLARVHVKRFVDRPGEPEIKLGGNYTRRLKPTKTKRAGHRLFTVEEYDYTTGEWSTDYAGRVWLDADRFDTLMARFHALEEGVAR